MLDKNLEIRVQNRDSGTVGYTVPDLGIHRTFTSGEIKTVTVDEIRKLSYLPGGKSIIKNYLLIKNKELVNELLGEVEPEYAYSGNEVRNLLLNGSLDELKDCLDFAPQGVIELIKKFAVDLKINDIAKRQAIQEATGFNINSMIDLKQEDEKIEQTPKKERRVNKTTTNTTTRTRRTVVPKTSVEE